ncbi:TSET complex member tstB [Senna tora]|uniref:TSET complex member tstB n=1 Tax=Senna tora TaxID=362788 RepID=A0A834TE50_9FABA|nr:TSET complex member tstB [Senna tora]
MMLSLAITLACVRLRRLASTNPTPFDVLHPLPPPSTVELTVAERGLDEDTLNTYYPKMPYSEVVLKKKGANLNTCDDSSDYYSSCSICLGDFQESDTLRLLPDCGHLYHVSCVDPWLRCSSSSGFPQDSSGTTLMDLITADPTSAPSSAPSASNAAASSAAAAPAGQPTALGKPAGEKRSKRAAFMQIQTDTLTVAKAALGPVRNNIMPQKQKKKPVSYSQLARSIHELAATSDQKNSQRQLVRHVFPKLAVYNSVDPSLAPSLLMLNQQCEDRNILRNVYYYLARILSDNGAQGLSSGGGIPTPNWDALADIDAVGGVTRADVVPRIVEQLTSEAKNADVECVFTIGMELVASFAYQVVMCESLRLRCIGVFDSGNTVTGPKEYRCRVLEIPCLPPLTLTIINLEFEMRLDLGIRGKEFMGI